MNDAERWDPQLLEATRVEDGWRFALRVPAASSLFDGHFPGHPVLPGVAQLHWAVDLYRAHTGDQREIAEVRRAKFRRLIAPEDHLELHCAVRAGQLRIDYRRTGVGSSEEIGSAVLVLASG